jgi:hypothetical protein
VPTDDALETRLFELWTRPPDTTADALAAFGAVYADPVLINGAPMALRDLVARVRGLHVAFTEHEIEIEIASPSPASSLSRSGTRPRTPDRG